MTGREFVPGQCATCHSRGVVASREDGRALCNDCASFGPPAEVVSLPRAVSPSQKTALRALGRTSDGSWESDGSREIRERREGSRAEDRTRARATALGSNVSLGESFVCVLPGHTDRATLYPTPAGYWRYRCGDWTAGFAEVRASIGYGRARRVGHHDDAIGQTEVARWAELLDYEAGLVTPEKVEHELPHGLSDAATAVARGALLLLALRDDRWAGQGFVMSRRFTVAWCGISEYAAQRGLRELRDAGWLVLDGTQKRAHRYQLTEPAPVPQTAIERYGGENGLIAALVKAFDAVEVEA